MENAFAPDKSNAEDTRKKEEEEEKIHGSSTSQAMLGCGRCDGIMI